MPDELQARMDAVRRFTVATQGEAVAKTKMEAMRTVGDLQRAENELAAYRARLNMAPPRPAPASAPPAAAPAQTQARVSEEQWQQMPAAERLDYCRRFPQSTDGGPRR
jgi:hypothetical protein